MFAKNMGDSPLPALRHSTLKGQEQEINKSLTLGCQIAPPKSTVTRISDPNRSKTNTFRRSPLCRNRRRKSNPCQSVAVGATLVPHTQGRRICADNQRIRSERKEKPQAHPMPAVEGQIREAHSLTSRELLEADFTTSGLDNQRHVWQRLERELL